MRSLISADPRILSLIILLIQSIVSCDSLNNLRTFQRTNANVIPIIGMTKRTARASLQLIIRSRILAQIIRKTEDIIEEIACATNVFTESTSEVRFVSNFDGVAVWT